MNSIFCRQPERGESVLRRAAVGDVRVRWAGGSGGRALALLALLTCLLWVAARQGAIPAGQAEQWAELPAGVRPSVASAARPLPGSEQALRPHRPRLHTPPTWQQEREAARSELRSLCREARQSANWLEARARSPQYDPRRPAAVEVGQAMHAALAHAAQEEGRIEAQLDRARGFRDIDAAQREIGKIRRVVSQTQSWLHARRMSGALDGPRRDQARGATAGRVRDLPPAPGWEEAGRGR
jgi:hypothetical protein